MITAKVRGRPREIVDPVRVSVTVPTTDYDRYLAIAHANGHNSVARVIREQAFSASQNRQPHRNVHNQS